MRALLASLVVLLVLAAPAGAQQGVLDRAAEALKTDRVYVDPDAGSDVDADALRSQIEEAGTDVRIAVLPESAGPATQVAGALAQQLGEGGTLAVVVGSELRAGPSADARRAAGEAVAAQSGQGAQAVLSEFVERDADAGGIGVGTLILIGVAGGGAAVAIGGSVRRQRRREAEELAEVKDNARDDLVALGDDIRALDVDIEMPDASPAARADYETALNAYDRADQRWRLARKPAELEPVGEALEEGRWAMSSAKARLEGREPPERRPPCFFDPRHGPSTRDVEWAPLDGAPRSVPACEADAQRVDRGEDPEARHVTVGGQSVPYWSAGPAYAPFMGGFYGGGLLPGLLIGTALGGGWGGSGGDGGGDAGGGGDWGGGDFGGGDFGGGGDF